MQCVSIKIQILLYGWTWYYKKYKTKMLIKCASFPLKKCQPEPSKQNAEVTN